jgi:hypothetical protein
MIGDRDAAFAIFGNILACAYIHPPVYLTAVGADNLAAKLAGYGNGKRSLAARCGPDDGY